MPYDEFDIMLKDINEEELEMIGRDQEVKHLIAATFWDSDFSVIRDPGPVGSNRVSSEQSWHPFWACEHFGNWFAAQVEAQFGYQLEWG